MTKFYTAPTAIRLPMKFGDEPVTKWRPPLWLLLLECPQELVLAFAQSFHPIILTPWLGLGEGQKSLCTRLPGS